MTARPPVPTILRSLRPSRDGWVVALLLAMACGGEGSGSSTTGDTDPGSTGTTAEASTSGTTAGETTTGLDDTRGTGTSITGDSTGTGSTTDPSASDSGESTTGTPGFDVPFIVLDPIAVPLSGRVPPGWSLVTSVAEWDALTGGAPVPAGVSLPRQWLLFGSRGPLAFPGHALEITTLRWNTGTLEVEGIDREPAGDCETFQFTWPADTLVAFDALPVEVDDVDDQTLAQAVSCAMGAGDSMSCDLETPCATGLLCAGLIRSTVLANSPDGLCLPSSYAGVFTGPSLPIPADGSTAESPLVVDGLTTVDMDVVIWVELDHPAPEQLVIELRNPSDNQVPVASLPATPLHPGGVGIVPTGFSGDESVNGTWWLVVRDDVVDGNDGTVSSWELEIMSRYD